MASSFQLQAKNNIRYIEGPIQAKIVKVIDGDTILVDAMPWPSQTIRVYVRLRNINTPELRSSCERERIAAHKAKNALISLVGHEDILLYRISGGKYYGRVLADIKTKSGQNASDHMLRIGLAEPYKKGRRKPFCKTS